MPINKWQLATFALVGVVIQDQYTNHKLRKRNAELSESGANLASAGLNLCAQLMYLSDVLDKNGIKVTEFDKIAMNNITIKLD